MGLLGIGVVGSGVHRLLKQNRASIDRRAGRAIELRRIAARDVARARAVVNARGDVDALEVSTDAMGVVTDPDIDVVVEVIGGCTAARELVMAAIAHGKHVVTANKALLAQHGEEIFAAAEARGVVVAYEGAVAVSIPIVKALREGLAANEIGGVVGIVNGTSNFVLTRMRERGMSFDDALREAQRLGYAEADPAFDVDGIDSAHKLALLASLAFGMPLAFERIAVTGIRGLQLADLLAAERLGHRAKLLACAWRRGDRVDLRVEPALVPAGSLMAAVDESLNGILVHGNASGPTMYCGAGAGSLETASAVVGDLVELARAALVPAHCRVPTLAIARDQSIDLATLPARELAAPHYLRVTPAPRSDLDLVLRTLAAGGISVSRHVEATPSDTRPGIALLTRPAPRPVIDEAIGLLRDDRVVDDGVVCLRVESLR